MKKISSFKVMDILEKAIEMDDVIHLEVGEPAFETPKEIKEEGIRAINEERITYTHSMGMKELREAVASYYNRNYGTDVNYNNVVISSGTSPALLLAVYIALEASGKKEILVPNPGYACYPNFITFLNGKIRHYDLDIGKGFRLDIEKLKEVITDDTAAVVINSPSNPTGVVMSPEEYEDLSKLDVMIISDEIYQGLVYEGKIYDTILNYSKKSMVLNGLSKLFAMTGWRLGYLIVPDEYIDLAQRLEQNLFISANTVSQYAAIEALTNDKVEEQVQEMREEYNKRRLIAIKELEKYKLKIAGNPMGAYYIIIDTREYTENSLEFSYKILEEANVAVTPGIDFGSNLEGYIRISYAVSEEDLVEGIRRLGEYLKKLK